MWQKINRDYYFKYKLDINYKLCLTNFVDIWSCILTKEQFIKSVKESNIQLETSEDNLIEQVTNMLQDTEGAQCICELIMDNVIHARIMKKSTEGYPVKLKFKLLIGSKQMFFHEVTLSLMNTIKDLTESQKDLFTALRKKDREIESYKLDGATLSLGQLKTPRFNEEEHLCKHSVFIKAFKSNQIPEEIIKKQNDDGYIDSNIKDEILSQNEIKEEPPSQTSVILPKEERPTQMSVNLPNKIPCSREHVKMEPTTPKKKPRKLLNL